MSFANFHFLPSSAFFFIRAATHIIRAATHTMDDALMQDGSERQDQFYTNNLFLVDSAVRVHGSKGREREARVAREVGCGRMELELVSSPPHEYEVGNHVNTPYGRGVVRQLIPMEGTLEISIDAWAQAGGGYTPSFVPCVFLPPSRLQPLPKPVATISKFVHRLDVGNGRGLGDIYAQHVRRQQDELMREQQQEEIEKQRRQRLQWNQQGQTIGEVGGFGGCRGFEHDPGDITCLAAVNERLPQHHCGMVFSEERCMYVCVVSGEPIRRREDLLTELGRKRQSVSSVSLQEWDQWRERHDGSQTACMEDPDHGHGRPRKRSSCS